MSQYKGMVRAFIALVSTVFVVGLVVSWIVAEKLVAPCLYNIGPIPADLPVEVISLESRSGSYIRGWHIPAHSQNGVVVLLHGIRGSRHGMLQRARLLHGAGYSTVMIDFQAHGESQGDHITLGHLERYDVQAAVAFAKATHPGEAIGVVGVSLGGVATVLASPLGVDAIVLESVYPDIAAAVHNRVAAKLGVFSMIPAELLLIQLEPRLNVSASQLRPIDNITRVDAPLFIISGREDRYTTTMETQSIYRAAYQPKQLWLVDDAGHEDLYRVSPVEYKTHVMHFLDQYLKK